MSTIWLYLAITWSLPRDAKPGVTSGYFFLAALTLPPNYWRRAGMYLYCKGRTSCVSQVQGNIMKAVPPPLRQHTWSSIRWAAGTQHSGPTPDSAEPGGTRRALHNSQVPRTNGRGGSAPERLALLSLISLFLTCTCVKRWHLAFNSAVLLII